MKRLWFILFMFFTLKANSLSFERSFKGRINNYPITVLLNCEENNVVGYYYYNRFKEHFTLKGVVSGKTIDLAAFDANGKVRERFSGVLSKNDITGIWTDVRSQIKYP